MKRPLASAAAMAFLALASMSVYADDSGVPVASESPPAARAHGLARGMHEADPLGIRQRDGEKHAPGGGYRRLCLQGDHERKPTEPAALMRAAKPAIEAIKSA
jgi:hypothetical protein